MNFSGKAVLCVVLASIGVAGSALGDASVLPQGGAYTMQAQVIGAGTVRMQGAGYALDGTAGQADAGRLDGGAYGLEGGFWAALNAGGGGDSIFRSGFD